MHLVERCKKKNYFETHGSENQQYQYNFRYISGYLKLKSNEHLITKQNLEAKRFFFKQETETESKSTPLTETDSETEILTENAIEIEKTETETETLADAEPKGQIIITY
jgi:hypothetical protein